MIDVSIPKVSLAVYYRLIDGRQQTHHSSPSDDDERRLEPRRCQFRVESRGDDVRGNPGTRLPMGDERLSWLQGAAQYQVRRLQRFFGTWCGSYQVQNMIRRNVSAGVTDTSDSRFDRPPQHPSSKYYR